MEIPSMCPRVLYTTQTSVFDSILRPRRVPAVSDSILRPRRVPAVSSITIDSMLRCSNFVSLEVCV